MGRDEEITSSPFKKGGDENKETKQKKRQRVTDYTITSQQPCIYSYRLISKHKPPPFYAKLVLPSHLSLFNLFSGVFIKA